MSLIHAPLRCLPQLLVAVLLPLAVVSASGARAGAPVVSAVASFSILADMTRAVGGERVTVHALVGSGSDAHTYRPRPADVQALARADLFIANGLGFEGWIDRLVASSGYAGPVIYATDGITPLEEPDDHGHPGHHTDPHAWHDLRHAMTYVDNIARALIARDPAGADYYRVRQDSYQAELTELDKRIRAFVDRLPEDQRLIITSHDAFGYFANAYGLIFLSPQGLNTEAQPSAADVAHLIRLIRQHNAAAVFVENMTDPRLTQQIARETGSRIGGTLYSDALTPPNGPAPTFTGMIRRNLQTLEAALAPAGPASSTAD